MSSLRFRFKEFLKRIKCLVACCNSKIIIENSQIDGKPNEEEEDGQDSE